MECGVPISVWDSGDVGGYGDSRHDVVEQLFDVVREDTYYVIDRQLGGTFRTASGIACGCGPSPAAPHFCRQYLSATVRQCLRLGRRYVVEERIAIATVYSEKFKWPDCLAVCEGSSRSVN